MKKIVLLLFLAGLASCTNTTAEEQLDTLKKNADTLVKKVETSEVMDSLKSKSAKLLDSAKSKGSVLWDSTKIKGRRLVNKGQKEVNDLKTKF